MATTTKRSSRFLSFMFFAVFGWSAAGCLAQSTQQSALEPTQQKTQSETASSAESVAEVAAESGEEKAELAASAISLFDGKTLDGWEAIQFGGEGECRVADGKLLIERGGPLTGIVSTREDLPLTNYELTLEARQTGGLDFFCGLTFPVADSHCTFVVGGWAGSVVGLSCIDGEDASRNETRKLMKFEENQWYKIKVRVQPDRIEAWIDDKQVVDQNIKDKKISLRNEVLDTAPVGICNFESDSEFKNIQLKKLPEKP